LSLGIATSLTAAISGVSAFAQLELQAAQQGARIWVQIVVGVFGFTAAGLAALQAFFRSSELAVQHKQTAQKFGQLRRELEENLDLGLPGGREEREQLLTSFRNRWNAVDDESRPIPQRIYKKTKADIRKRKKSAAG
jgi:hypothetical protein